MAGISDLQGGHQLAQKLIRTGLPRNSDNVYPSLPNVSSLKSGARKPSCGAGISPWVVLLSGVTLSQIQVAPMVKTRIENILQVVMVNLFILVLPIEFWINETC
jgi:hypothetical protein